MIGLNSGYVKEQTALCSPTLIHEEIQKFGRQNRIAIITDTELGNPNHNIRTSQLPKKKIFREYGKLHAVYAACLGDDEFSITSLIFKEALAERHADLLVLEDGYDAAIVTSAYSVGEIEKMYTREGLDERGHHYVAQ